MGGNKKCLHFLLQYGKIWVARKLNNDRRSMKPMTHNAKEILAAVAAAGLAITLSGCADKEQPSSETNTSTTSDTTSSTQSSAISSRSESSVASSNNASVPLSPANSTLSIISDAPIGSAASTPVDPDNASKPSEETSNSVENNPSTPTESIPASSGSAPASTPISSSSKPEQSKPTPSSSKPVQSSSTPASKPASSSKPAQSSSTPVTIVNPTPADGTPSDTTGVALDANGHPADAIAWLKEHGNSFVDSSGQLWVYDRRGWRLPSAGGTIADGSNIKPSGNIIGH